jgi:hypothetical protein
MDTSSEARRTAERPVAKDSRLRSLATLLIFDIAGPLVAYSLLRKSGMSAVTALVISGVFPAFGVTISVIRHRRVDAVGVLVLAGIIVGTVTGLLSHSAKLVLVEGSVPTAVFGLASLGSLRARYPLMFSLAREFIGPDTARGQEMTTLWQLDGYRRVFRIITIVWGVAFLIEAALRVVIIYNTSTGTALAISKVMPFVFVAIMLTWTFAYGTRQKKKGERMAAAGEVKDPALLKALSSGDDPS